MEVLSDIIRQLFTNNKKVKSINRNKYIEMRYRYDENFDLAYFLNLHVSNIKPGHKNFIAVQILQYSLIFEDSDDKIVFCKKYIQKVEKDEDDFFKEHKEVKEGLLVIFRLEWDTLRKFGKIDNSNTELLNQLLNIKSKINSIEQIQSQLQIFIEKEKSNRKKGRRGKILSYADLFKNTASGKELKELFKKFGYTNDKGEWCGQTNARNELAIAYYVLKEPEYGFQLIKQGDKKPQLIALYKEFRILVSEKAGSGAVSIRNLTSESVQRDTHEEFKQIFKPLLKYKT